MNNDMSCIRDPADGGLLTLEDGELISRTGRRYPIVNGIPRFVEAENYCADFGAQWNMFPRTQLDSFSGIDLSESRLKRCLQGDLKRLRGKNVLEAGSGAGRFTEVLLKYGAIVHSFDFSNAVEANAENNGDHKNLVLVQGDIRQIPYPMASYDYVICLGVLQHTPSPEESIRSLWAMVTPGGALVVDHYQWKWRIVLPPPIGQALDLYRLWILKLPKEKRFGVVKKLTDFWFPLHWKFKDSWLVTKILRRISPVIFHYPYIKLNDVKQYYNWALLDTHDSTTDFYKHYRTPAQIRSSLEGIGATDISVQCAGNGIEAFCRKYV